MNELLVVDLAQAGTSAGGKAAGLARLCAAGLPVPPGFALTAAAFRVVSGTAERPAGIDDLGAALAGWAHAAEAHPIPAALEAEVVARARALGGPLVVRSSMAIEDGAARAAPGVGRSMVGVPADDVWTAIRAVWVASLTPMVAIYARGEPIDDVLSPGVVVQRQIAGERMTVYTRAPGRPDADEVWLSTAQRTVTTRGDARAPVALALAAERAIEAARGADVELVCDVSGAWFVVQARPLVHPAPRPRKSPPPPFVLAALRASGRRWRRDVAHNPEPLSTAQAELCALVERAAIAPFHLAVAAGFLYDAPREGVVGVAPPRTPAELDERVAAAAATVDAALSTAGDDLDRALDAYLVAYGAIVELAPLIAAARGLLVDRISAEVSMYGRQAPSADDEARIRRYAQAQAAELAPRRPSSLVAAVAAAARGEIDRGALLALAGDFAPAWDVASPTFAETPALLDDAIARARARPAPPPEPPAALFGPVVAIARAAADAAERDDALFARAQATVRRALLATAARLGMAAPEVFWLSFDELRAARPDDEGLRERLAARAAANRAAAARAALWDMPLVVAPQPQGSDAAHTDDAGAPTSWRGDGFGGRATGPVARMDQLADAARVPRGAIVVTRTVTPAMALLVEGAAAIVCEHGSLLDHGAAMARELGIPCVVGCGAIVDAVIDGEWLDVDAGDGNQPGSVVRVVTT